MNTWLWSQPGGLSVRPSVRPS